jgi:hypothetical protein
MNTRQIIAGLALGATLFSVAACAEDEAADRSAPASEQSEDEGAEYED